MGTVVLGRDRGQLSAFVITIDRASSSDREGITASARDPVSVGASNPFAPRPPDANGD